MTDDSNIDDELKALSGYTPTTQDSSDSDFETDSSAYQTAESRLVTPSVMNALPRVAQNPIKQEPEPLSTIPVKKKTLEANPFANNRVFRGNINYVNFYNRFVTETLDLVGMDGIYHSELYGSRLTHDGEMYYGVYANRPGTTWTRTEKEKFFRALSVYSIHRIEAIREFVGTKSITEIQNYYEVLKKELKRRRNVSRHLKKFKYIKNGKKKVLRLPRRPKSLLTYDELPIAYEMSDEWIKFEEEQSEVVALKERSRTNDQTRHFTLLYNHYVKKEQLNFLDPERLHDLTNRIYIEQNWNTDVNRGIRMRARLDLKSLVFLEEFIINIVKKIIYRTIERLMFRGNSSPIIVKKHDIRPVMNELGYHGTEDTFNWNKYWGDIQRRLKTEVIDDVTNGRIMTPEESSEYILSHSNYWANHVPWLEMKSNWKKFEPEVHIDDPFSGWDKDFEMKQDVNEQGEEVMYFSTLMQNQREERQNKELVKLSDEKDETYIKIQRYLNKLEEITLEERDWNESRIHERGLATYMMTNEMDRIKGVVYTPEEAEEVLKYWKCEEANKEEWLQDFYERDDEKRFKFKRLRKKMLKLRAERTNQGSEAIAQSDQVNDNLFVMDESSDNLELELELELEMELELEPELKMVIDILNEPSEDEEDTDTEILVSQSLVNYFKYSFADYSHDQSEKQ